MADICMTHLSDDRFVVHGKEGLAQVVLPHTVFQSESVRVVLILLVLLNHRCEFVDLDA